MGLSADREAKADRARINALLRTWYATGALVVVERRDEKKRELKPFVEVGTWAVDGVAPLAQGGAGQGGASRAPELPRPTCPPVRGRGGAAGAAEENQVGQNQGGAAKYPFGNKALKPIEDDPDPFGMPSMSGGERR